MSQITLAHHWLVTYRGGEKVLAEFRHLFPEAPIATLVANKGSIPDWIMGREILTSWLQYLPGAGRFYKQLLPLHASAFGRLKVPTTTRLVLSSDAAMVKGLVLPDGAKQVCYCHSPPRYLWDMQDAYSDNASQLGTLGRLVFKHTVPAARRFDYRSAQRVDAFIANSKFVAQRIKSCYGKQATVIYPPVAYEDFDFRRARQDFYLVVCQLVPYKRIDIAIRAFNALGKNLVVIGEGSEFRLLQRIAGPTIKLLGKQSFAVVKEHFETCRAFIHPQVEDFGITAVEAQAAGRPVLAFRAGGALETIQEGKTGLFFEKQDAEALAQAVTVFESGPLLSEWDCRRWAEQFGRARFRREVSSFLMAKYPEILAGHHWPIETTDLLV